VQSINTTQEETYFDHGEDNAEGAKNGLGRRDAAEFLCKIGDLDGQIERGDGDVSAFLLLSVGSHGFKVDVIRGNVVVSRTRGISRTQIGTSGNCCSAFYKQPFREETAA
jgi:hypothetical protein